jgi:predicted enzyme related to lactoylglutathione lyase
VPPPLLKSKLILCNVPTSDSSAAQAFYGALLGADDFLKAPNEEESYTLPLSQDGVDLNITRRYDDQERLTCYFAVDDLDEALRVAEENGGKLMVEPRTVPIDEQSAKLLAASQRGRVEVGDSVGRMAVVLDPDGNHVGLMQLAGSVHRHFRWGEAQRPLEADQVEDHARALKSAC